MKRWLMLAVAASMLLGAGCGGSDSEEPASTTMSQEQGCAEVRKLQDAIQKLREDVDNSEIDMGGMMKETSNIATRTRDLANRLEPGPLQDAAKQWATATETQLNDPSEENQVATFDARDRVDDVCGFPHGPRDTT